MIVLSGEIASGKSTLAKALGGSHLKTRDAIMREVMAAAIMREVMAADCAGEGPVNRHTLQTYGDALDESSEGGRWLTPHVLRALSDGLVVVDAARRIEQVEALRDSLPPSIKLVHVHLFADEETLRDRYFDRGDVEDYDQIKNNGTERRVPQLVKAADLVLDTTRCSVEDSVIRVLACFGRRPQEKLVDVLVGGQYGSEGKGHIVAHLAPEYDVLLRVGGPNAGHTVLHPITDKRVSFYHLPSGALHCPRAKLILGPGAVINIDVLTKEAEHLGGLANLAGRLFIDPQAMVIGPADIKDEANLVSGIGSTGQGVGFATGRKILMRDRHTRLARDYSVLAPFMRKTLDILDESYRAGHRVMLEGTQGTGLSLHHGHYPYVTSRETSASGTMGEAGVAPLRIRKSIVVLRTFPIRVQSPQGGTSGPMGLETTWERVSGLSGEDPDTLREREKTTTTKRQRRVAEFSWADLDRAVMLNSPTDLALTFVDYLDPSNPDARRYEQLSPSTLRFVEEVERVAGTPVSLINTRCHRRSVIDRRSW